MLCKKYNRRDEKMDTKQDNRKVNLPINKLTIALAAIGISGGVFFGAFLSAQTQTENAALSEQTIVASKSILTEVKIGGGIDAPIITESIQKTEKVEKTSDDISYIIIGDTPVDARALTFNSDGTMSWDSSFTPPAGYVVVDGLLYPEDASPSTDQKHDSSITRNKPSVQQTIENKTDKAEIKPIPSQENSTSDDSSRDDDVEYNGSPVSRTADCPAFRNDNLSLYDECRNGFVAPTIRWAGYHSCEKRADGTVNVIGKVELVGGNYNSEYWSWNHANIGKYGLVSSLNSSSPYFVSWSASAWFGSMSPKGAGIIAKVYESNINKIDESLLDPSCRF